jgi:hypothetical protein
MTPCPKCHVNLDLISGDVILDQARPHLHCPICGKELTFPNKGGFTFDEIGKELIVWGKAICEIRYGGLTLHIQGKEMHIADCLYRHVAFFQALDRTKVSPVRPENQHLIESCHLASGGGNHAVVYEVIAAGGYRESLSVACTTIPNPPAPDKKQNEAALFVWPNFKMKAREPKEQWRRYYALFVTPSIADGIGKINRVASESGDGRVSEIKCVDAHWADLDMVPDLMEIKWDSARDQQTYYSVVRPEFKQITPIPVADVTLGFDFGTSNTAAAIRIVRGRERNSEDVDLLRIDDLTLVVVPGEITKDTLWLPRPSKPTESLPTYLYFPLLENQQINDALRPVQDYVIPFSQRDLVDRLSVGGFKWKKLVAKPLQESVASLRYLYLRLALEMYLAQAVASWHLGRCVINLVATFPLAFDSEHQELHHEGFQKVTDAISQSCPFQFTLASDLSESHAGENGSDRFDEIDELLIVDCGGGTTDICVTEPVRENDSDVDGPPGKRRAVFQQDSIEYGGEKLVEAVQKQTRGPISLFELRQMIRTREAAALEDGTLYVDRRAGERAQQISWNFRRGLIEICARFIAARMESLYSVGGDNPRFGLLMLGNGWKLLAPAAQAKGIAQLDTFVKDLVTKRVEAYVKAGSISRLPREIKVEYSASAKGAVALGAAKVHSIEVWPGQQEQTYMLLDMVMSIGNSQSTARKLRWNATVPYTLDCTPTALKVDGAQQFGFDDTEIGASSGVPVSDFNFLEACAPDAARKKQIRKSPFGVYMRMYGETFAPKVQGQHAP